MRIGSLFAGYGGLELGVMAALGGTVAWHSEIDPGACRILAHHWPDVPNLGDVAAVDWAGVEPVDVLTGGFPCQDVSAAGKRAGIRAGTRSGLWAEFARGIDTLRPSLVVIENVRGLLSAAAEHPAHSDMEPCPWCLGNDEPVTLRALGAVLGDLADLGYDAAWHGLRAADVGAPHGRYRVFVAAWPAAGHADHFGPQDRHAGQPGGAAAGPGAAADSGSKAGHLGSGPSAGPAGRRRLRPGPGHRGGDLAAADTVGRGCHGRAPDPVGVEVGRTAAAGRGQSAVSWGPYAAAVERWEAVTRPAPPPTETNARGNQRLSPAFVEWMMGLPAGHVTALPGLSRNEQLKALGNGVVPQQATAALSLLSRHLPMTLPLAPDTDTEDDAA